MRLYVITLVYTGSDNDDTGICNQFVAETLNVALDKMNAEMAKRWDDLYEEYPEDRPQPFARGMYVSRDPQVELPLDETTMEPHLQDAYACEDELNAWCRDQQDAFRASVCVHEL